MATNSNNRESHKEWFVISGHQLAEFPIWCTVEPTNIIMPEIGPQDEVDYVSLNELEVGQIPLSSCWSNDLIFSLWNSGNITLLPYFFVSF